jgi:hypothetical protein
MPDRLRPGEIMETERRQVLERQVPELFVAERIRQVRGPALY